MLALLAGVVWGLVAFDAAAQVAPDGGRLLQDQERLRRSAPLRSVPLPQPDEAAQPGAAAPDGVRVRVSRFQISRASLFGAATLDALVADLVGRELSLAELDGAAGRITDFYRQRGYFIARAYLPVQDITDGVVEITLLEGILGTLHLNNRSGLGSGLLRAYFDDVPQGRPLSGNALERDLMLVGGLAGVDVQSTLRPGASVGSTDLDVRVASLGAVSGNASLDNYGNRFTGSWRAGAQVNLNSPLGRGDVLSARGYASEGIYRYARLAYQTPLGSRGLQLGGAWSFMTYRLGLDFAALEAHGTASVGSLYALYPVQRSRNASVSLQLNLDQKSQSDRTDSTGTGSDRTALVGNLGLSGERADGFAGGGGTSWNVGHSRGRLRLDAATLALDDAGHRTSGSYVKWTLAASRQQNLALFGPAWSVLGQVSGQLAGKNLDSSEKNSLGGVQAVRAYPQGEAACDDAVIVNLDLRYAPAQDWLLSGFYDLGAGQRNHAPGAAEPNNLRRLQGAGMGANFNRRGLSVVAALAWRTGPAPVSDRDRSPRLWINLQKAY